MLEQTDETRTGTLVSRRTVLGGLVAGAVTAATLGTGWGQGQAEAAPALDILAPPALMTGERTPRFQHAAAPLSGGRVLLTGGRRDADTPALAGSQIFHPAACAWWTSAPMHTARAEHAAVALGDGRVLVVGGRGPAPLAGAEIYDPAHDRWTPAAPMPQARYGHTATLAGGLVIVTGGFQKKALAGVQVYEVATDRWQRMG